MKTKQEQIEEMARVIRTLENVGDINYRFGTHFAGMFYKAGYRKASDIINEFVERMKEENETSFRRYGKGIGMHDIFLIADKMKFEIFAEMQKEGK